MNANEAEQGCNCKVYYSSHTVCERRKELGVLFFLWASWRRIRRKRKRAGGSSSERERERERKIEGGHHQMQLKRRQQWQLLASSQPASQPAIAPSSSSLIVCLCLWSSQPASKSVASPYSLSLLPLRSLVCLFVRSFVLLLLVFCVYCWGWSLEIIIGNECKQIHWVWIG